MRRINYIIVCLVGFVSLSFAQSDSLGIERQGDKVFVIHKVKPQQTLYSLSRRYKTTVSEINSANPVLANGLQIGQTLKIPYGGVLISPDAQVTSRTQEITHRVKAGETLFAIARKYDVQVSDIKAWNGLSSNAINLGQGLVIKRQVLTAVEQPKEEMVEQESVEESTTVAPKGINVPDSVKVADKPFESSPEVNTQSNTEIESVEVPEDVNYPGTPFEPKETEGIAEVIQESEPSSKFFALHRTAKVGTVIKVKNLMNDLTVYVRVIGTIPETSENENVIIKLNQRAYDHLKAVDKRFRVKLNYFK
ncbi:MAG: LysM peptidoglycan-binding domain-containing protein [Roseivirga sp.]|uniref:LysM peptidoglycan-binding domain-containing protein n=1 Tax=Roseivirga sp. TaxID=1964215 RepID=UPI001B26D4E1|nr:LysM peptidoglycan-binding domain-containing protein [Roseivirga sp.]MBO6494778.1 LysM peptidoglycan-binding domain-containing protein [Roseivirga sp.]